MRVVDSSKEQVVGPNIILMAVEDQVKDVPKPQAMAAIAAEISLPSTDVVQFGNTVFITHIGSKEDNKHKAWGRALNIDTARNFVENGFTFFTHLQSLGITRYTTWYDGSTYDSAFKAFQRIARRQAKSKEGRTEIILQRNPKLNKTVAFVRLGKDPLVWPFGKGS